MQSLESITNPKLKREFEAREYPRAFRTILALENKKKLQKPKTALLKKLTDSNIPQNPSKDHIDTSIFKHSTRKYNKRREYLQNRKQRNSNSTQPIITPPTQLSQSALQPPSITATPRTIKEKFRKTKLKDMTQLDRKTLEHTREQIIQKYRQLKQATLQDPI